MMRINEVKKEVAKIRDDEKIDTITSIGLDIKRDKSRTDKLKNEFIQTIMYEYGDELRSNPNGAKFIKQGFWYKIKKSINKFFNIF